MEHAAHAGYTLVEFQVAIVIPHEAGNAVASLDTVCLEGIGQLLGTFPGLLQSLAMDPVSLSGNDFDSRV
jgi:hypothetical protein